MSLPKNLSDTLIKKLNRNCELFSEICLHNCDDLGWCHACWIAAGSEKKDGGDINGNEQT